MKYNLLDGIEAVISQCIECGSGKMKLDNITTVDADWETWTENDKYDVVEVTIFQNGILKLQYQIAETKVLID